MCRFAPGGRRRLVRVAAYRRGNRISRFAHRKTHIMQNGRLRYAQQRCACGTWSVVASLRASPLRVGSSAGLRRRHRHALSARSNVCGRCAWARWRGFVYTIATRLNASAHRPLLVAAVASSAARIGLRVAVARGLLRWTSFAASPRAPARNVTGHTHCSLGSFEDGAVLGPSRTAQVRYANP